MSFFAPSSFLLRGGPSAPLAVFLHVHQYNVRTHLFDVMIRDRIIRFALKPVEKTAASRHDDLADLSAAFIELKISHPSKPLAVLDIDHFFCFKLRIKHPPAPKNAFLYFMHRPRPCFHFLPENRPDFMNKFIQSVQSKRGGRIKSKTGKRGKYHAGKSRNMRGQYSGSPALKGRRKGGSLGEDRGRRYGGERPVYPRKPAACSKRDQTLFLQQRKRGRPVPDRMCRPDQSHQQF